MYTLLHGFYKYMVQKDEYCVLILGLDNAGKTTYLEATKTKFTKKYKAMNPNRITTTVGLNIGKIDVDGVRLNFWDLGGQQELQSLWDKYYAECHAVIYIVDSSDRDRVSESKETFEVKNDVNDVLVVKPIRAMFDRIATTILPANPPPSISARTVVCSGVEDRMIASEHLSGVPLLVLANKQDIPDCMGVHTVKPIFNQNAHLIGARDIMLMATSALTGDGVDEGIRWLVDCIKRNSVDRPPRNQEDNL